MKCEELQEQSANEPTSQWAFAIKAVFFHYFHTCTCEYGFVCVAYK